MNMFLLSWDKFMPEMHLTKPEFKYSACGPLAKNRERTKKIKGKGDWRYIYQNELDKLAVDMTWIMEILKICLE